jgi:FixJ family two-component response regulator
MRITGYHSGGWEESTPGRQEPIGHSAGVSSEVNLISLVDDDASVRAATRALLRSAGYQVETFASADEFLASGALGSTDCVILDVRMPGIDGLELQRRLRTVGFRVPIIFITAHDDGSLRQRVIKAGAVDLLHKPFGAKLLLETVQAALEKRNVQP